MEKSQNVTIHFLYMRPCCLWTFLQHSDVQVISVKQCDSNEMVQIESHTLFLWAIVLIEFHHDDWLLMCVPVALWVTLWINSDSMLTETHQVWKQSWRKQTVIPLETIAGQFGSLSARSLFLQDEVVQTGGLTDFQQVKDRRWFVAERQRLQTNRMVFMCLLASVTCVYFSRLGSSQQGQYIHQTEQPLSTILRKLLATSVTHDAQHPNCLIMCRNNEV